MRKVFDGTKIRQQAVLAFVAAVIFLTSSKAVFASGEQMLTGDGSAEVPITATVSSSYTVVLPSTTQTLTDVDNDGTYTGTIAYDVFGKINADKGLVVWAGDDVSISGINTLISNGSYATKSYIETPFHMTGATGGRTVNGQVKQTVLRFLASGATVEHSLDRNIPSAKSVSSAPFSATVAIAIPYTDTFTGNLPVNFGLVEK